MSGAVVIVALLVMIWQSRHRVAAAIRPAESAEALEADSKMAVKHYVPFIKQSFRIVLIAFLFFVSLRLWGIDLSVGRVFTRDALSIVVVVLLGFITWEVIKARIDRKLKEEMPDEDEKQSTWHFRHLQLASLLSNCPAGANFSEHSLGKSIGSYPLIILEISTSFSGIFE